MKLRIQNLLGFGIQGNFRPVTNISWWHYCGNLPLQPDNGGVVMVNFYSGFVNCKSASEATLEDIVGMCTQHYVHDRSS
jgi:hypothetical protein